MMLFKVSFENIRKSFKDYAIYFFTLVLGVSIFYVFNAIESQTVMMTVSNTTHEMISLMNNIMGGLSIFVSIVLAFLIIFASKFMIKRRKKEFGIYLSLGMSKRKVSFMLWIETLLVGILSLVVGLALGILLSQLMSVFVIKLFVIDVSDFVFVFSKSAMIKTVVYFGVIFIVLMIFNSFMINKYELIDLLSADKKNEKIVGHNLPFAVIQCVVAVILLGVAYYNVTLNFKNLTSFALVIQQMVMGAIGTFLIFNSIATIALHFLERNSKIYYKDLNSFVIRQVYSKVNSTVSSMTVICLLLFLSICIFSSAVSMKSSLLDNVATLFPSDIYVRTFIEDNPQTISDAMINEGFDLEVLDNVVDIPIYTTDELMVADILEYVDKDEYTGLRLNGSEEIIKETDYNKLASINNLKPIHLEDGKFQVVANFKPMVAVRNDYLAQHPQVKLNNQTLIPQTEKVQDGFIQPSVQELETGFYVVKDEVLKGMNSYSRVLLANYKSNTSEKTKMNFETMLEDFSQADNGYRTISKSNTLEVGNGLGAMVVFIGLYLGIIFLITSAAILSLKELSESADNKKRYDILRKIGASEAMIDRALFKQVFIFFALPLLLAIIHSYFGILAADNILQSMGTKSVGSSILMAAVLIIIIYGGYFLLTYTYSKRIIKE